MGIHLRVGAAVFAALLLAGACGGGSDDGDSPDAAPDSPAAEETASEEAASSGECGGSGGEGLKLEASNFQFEPSDLGAPAGEQVTVAFTNSDDVPHTFTISDLACDTGSVAGGDTAELSLTMPDAETEFVCLIHPDMKGTLTPE